LATGSLSGKGRLILRELEKEDGFGLKNRRIGAVILWQSVTTRFHVLRWQQSQQLRHGHWIDLIQSVLAV
jgi:hypothetical protein